MSDKTFVQGGVFFIIGTIVLLGYSEKLPEPYNVKDAYHTQLWRQDTARASGLFCMDQATADKRRARNALLESVGDPPLATYARSYLEWLVVDLESRPAEWRHDVKCIRLLGRVKDFLKSLDSAEKCGTVEMLPEGRSEGRDSLSRID